MPWQETLPVDQRICLCTRFQSQEESMAELCRQFGVSRKTAYKWLARYRQEGSTGLLDHSRRPHHSPNRVNEDLKAAILAARDAHHTWGPKKLIKRMLTENPDLILPARSTVSQILKDHGRVIPRKKRRRVPPQSRPFASCDGPNSTWCVDFKGHFLTGDSTRCHPLTVTDAHSRYLLCCQGLCATGLEHVQPIFETTFRQYGLPLAIRSDNGPPFASRAIGGLSRLSIWWIRLGIKPDRIEPGKPQQNGRHERMHLTLKNETAKPPQSTFRKQQQRFEAFVEEYNNIRPHESLDMETPASRYVASTRSYPLRLPQMEYACGVRLRRVDARGQFSWKHENVFISEVLYGETIGFEAVDERYWRVSFGPVLLGMFDQWRRKMLSASQVRRLEQKWALQDQLPTCATYDSAAAAIAQ